MTVYPVLISIPHGGNVIPVELEGMVGLNEEEIFEDTDPFTKTIYDISDHVMSVVTTDIARAFIDVNRSSKDRPPANPDGVIKSHTCYNRPVYKSRSALDEKTITALLNNYYHPYHNKIRKESKHSEIQLALDCHSMAAIGPPHAPDTGEVRPAFCLSNTHGKSCSMETINKFAHCICTAFQLSEKDVAINKPFSGGYITQVHGMNPLPWIQVEMNRSLYLSKPWFNIDTRNMNVNRLKSLNMSFIDAVKLFFTMYEKLSDYGKN